jgi:murein DD-endopeptidase MepM/ murein hydrolase activator NlpD
MFAPLPGTLLVTQLHGSLKGGPGEAYMVNHDGVYYRCIGHAGIDFAAPVGTPVSCMKSGILTVTPNDPWHGGYAAALGLYAVITLMTGETHTYAHLSRVDLPSGRLVLSTTVFALSGNSGNVWPVPTPQQPNNGEHLHVGVRPEGVDWANHFDGTIGFLDRYNHDVLIDLSRV